MMLLMLRCLRFFAMLFAIRVVITCHAMPCLDYYYAPRLIFAAAAMPYALPAPAPRHVASRHTHADAIIFRRHATP